MDRPQLEARAREAARELFDGLPHDVPAVLEEPTIELLIRFAELGREVAAEHYYECALETSASIRALFTDPAKTAGTEGGGA